MLTCVTCTCYVTSLGWGDVNVHGNLRHMRMPRHVTGWGDVNVHVPLRHMHMLHATSRHWFGGGDVNVQVNLRRMHMLCHVIGLEGAMLTFRLTCVTCACYFTALGWASKNGGKLSVIKRGSKRIHNVSSCESLGQKLLSFLRKKHSVAQLRGFWRMNSKTFQNEKPFGGHWSLLEGPHGVVRGKKTPRTFSRENSL